MGKLLGVHSTRAQAAGEKEHHVEVLATQQIQVNRIEKLWWLMKHRWMALTRHTKVEMEHAVNHNFGGQFKMAS